MGTDRPLIDPLSDHFEDAQSHEFVDRAVVDEGDVLAGDGAVSH